MFLIGIHSTKIIIQLVLIKRNCVMIYKEDYLLYLAMSYKLIHSNLIKFYIKTVQKRKNINLINHKQKLFVMNW